MVLNRAGLAFIGRRIGGPEHIDTTHVWQLPQGGIDPGEDPWPAALRELREETNISSVERLGEIAEWLTYDIPPEIAGHAWNGKYRGQTQKWFALRFTGEESEIDVAHPAGGHEPEFVGVALGEAGEPPGPGRAVQAQESTSAWSRNSRNSPEEFVSARRPPLCASAVLQGLQLLEMARELVALQLRRRRRRRLPRHP